jgi:hypothetical protein
MFDNDTPPTYPVTVQDYIDNNYQKPWSDVLSWFLTSYLEDECANKTKLFFYMYCADAPESLIDMVREDSFPEQLTEEYEGLV